LSIRTTVSGGSGWLACVPQFAPIAPTPAAAKHSQETNTTAATAAPWPDRESMEGLFQLQIAGRFCWIALLSKNSFRNLFLELTKPQGEEKLKSLLERGARAI